MSTGSLLCFKDEEHKYLNDDRVYTPSEAPVIADMPPLLALLQSDMIQRHGYEVCVHLAGGL